MLTKELFEKQKALLDQFLRTGAINQAQYDKSLGTLKATFEKDQGEITCQNGDFVVK